MTEFISLIKGGLVLNWRQTQEWKNHHFFLVQTFFSIKDENLCVEFENTVEEKLSERQNGIKREGEEMEGKKSFGIGRNLNAILEARRSGRERDPCVA